MRDIKRIKRILKKMEKLWSEYPDQRLGQFIENYLIQPNRLFFQEDDLTEDRLDAVLKIVNLKDEKRKKSKN